MHLWKTRYDPEARIRRHSVRKGFGHGLLTPLVAEAFRELDVGAAVWEHGSEWWPLHAGAPSFQPFEAEHGADVERNRYNARQLARAGAEKKPVLASHGGVSDLFAPIVAEGRAVAVLVSGPFFTARPTASGILANWRSLSGRQGHPNDPEFSAYLAASLSILVLEGERLRRFEALITALTQLMSGRGDAAALANRVEALGAELSEIRSPERTWEAVRTMVDDRAQRAWHGVSHAHTLDTLGLSRVADHVLVGLSRGEDINADPVEEALGLDAFQRAAVDLARSAKQTVAGRVGARGILFVSALSGPAQRKRQHLRDLADRAQAVARRRFGLSFSFGLCVSDRSSPLSRVYESALGAAEIALLERTRILEADSTMVPSLKPLRELRQELAAGLQAQPALIAARFERYLEALAPRCGYRAEAAQGHLENALERLSEPLLASGSLDKRSYMVLSETLDRATRESTSIGELFAAYRRAVRDIEQAVQSPVVARRDRSLRSALDYVHQHFAEPIRLPQVARVAGFNPSHFSKLLIEREGMPFEEYLRRLRIDRACQLLSSSALDVARVSELSGFKTPQYFCRVFRRATGRTPLEYRSISSRIAAPTGMKR